MSAPAPAPTGGLFGASSPAPAFGGNASSGGGGFGSSSSSGGFQGGFGSSTPAKAKNEENKASTGYGASTSSTFGQASTSGGFGSSTPAKPKPTPFGNPSSSSSPFGGQRIPRKEKKKDEAMSEQNESSADAGGGAGGDDQLAALKARIQEKRKKLQMLKVGEQQQANQVGSKDNKKDDATKNAELAARNALRFGGSKEKKKDDAANNADLAAKNALRFATSNNDQTTLNKLLPSDLKGKSQQLSSESSNKNNEDSNSSAWITPADTEEEDNDVIDVNNAKSLIGVCQAMCPDEELLRREREGDIQLLEITDPGGIHPKEWSLRDTAVKRFRRSAADFKLDIPELVRPPEVLERVCGYLEEWVMVSTSLQQVMCF